MPFVLRSGRSDDSCCCCVLVVVSNERRVEVVAVENLLEENLERMD